jgi:hypothetical protein
LRERSRPLCYSERSRALKPISHQASACRGLAEKPRRERRGSDPRSTPHRDSLLASVAVPGMRWCCSMICATIAFVARSLHVRLDDASAAALDVVRSDGMTDSEAVRTALREAAARRRVRSAIREEVRRVAADEHDREEMRIIREQMTELAPSSTG